MKAVSETPWFVKWLGRPGFFRRENCILTPRLLLRIPKHRDTRQFNAWASDPQVARFVFWDAHTSLSQTRSVLRGILSQSRLGGLSSFVIVRQDDRRMVGTIGLVWRDWQNNSAEAGFSLARDCWGQGLMTEALTAFLRYVFEELGISRIEAQHDIRNRASGRVMEKAGMRLEGILRARLYYKGERADVALYAALREEWLDTHHSNAHISIDSPF